jgi:alpha-tubulin suppressor-like RCC1 family protein
MSSIKIDEIQDGMRQLVEVKSLPAKTKVRQVTFTRRRMFVMTENGELFVFPIAEIAPSQEEMMFSKKRPEFTGEVDVEKPVRVKEMPALKMISSGVDHLLALDRKGQVWAMGNDTFGQCG